MNRVQINGKRYYVQGEYPNYEIGVSVTEFTGKIYPTSDHLKDWWIDNSREFVENTLDETSRFGTLMHDYAEDFANGHNIKIDEMRPKMQHYLTSIAYFFYNRNVEPIATERRVFHRATDRFPLSFGGTLDLECILDWYGTRTEALVDYKSGNIYDKHKWQLVAYLVADAQNEDGSYDRMNKHIFNFSPNNWRSKPTGKPKHWKVSGQDLETFRSFCLIYNNEFHTLPNTVREFSSVCLGDEPQFEQVKLATYIKNQLGE